MRLLKATIISLFLLGCEQQSPAAHQRDRDEHVANHKMMLSRALMYFKDDTTGVCFAAMWMDSRYDGVLTSVPCSQAVESVANHFSSGSK